MDTTKQVHIIYFIFHRLKKLGTHWCLLKSFECTSFDLQVPIPPRGGLVIVVAGKGGEGIDRLDPRIIWAVPPVRVVSQDVGAELWVFFFYLGTEGSRLSSEPHQALPADILTLERVVSKAIAVIQAFLGRDGKGDVIV